MIDPHQRNVGVAFGTLLASSATLVCCVLPAVLVSLGAGAVLVGLVSAFRSWSGCPNTRAGCSASRVC